MFTTSKRSTQRAADEILSDLREKHRGRWTKAVLLALVMLHFTLSARAGQRELNLNRSLYVPVQFVACQHVKNVTMSMKGNDMVFPLGLRTFLFTYYVDRKDVLPEFVDVRIKGDGLCNGESFTTNVIITPEGTRSAVDAGSVDLASVKKQLRVRRDVRFPLRRVLITCEVDCEKQSSKVADSAKPTELPEPQTPQSSRSDADAPASPLN